MYIYGEYMCYNCGTITKAAYSLLDSINEDVRDRIIANTGITCKCGTYVQQHVNKRMRRALLSLAAKGYKVSLINEKTVCVVFNHKLTEEQFNKLPELPHEFSYDMTDPEGDIMLNARIQANDFEGLDISKEEYIKNAFDNFEDWCNRLPTLSDGEYIDLTESNTVSLKPVPWQDPEGLIPDGYDLTDGGKAYS